MSVIDTADAIKVIEALSSNLDRCTDTCWCQLGTHDKPARVMRWTPHYGGIVRFGPGVALWTRFRAGEWS